MTEKAEDHLKQESQEEMSNDEQVSQDTVKSKLSHEIVKLSEAMTRGDLTTARRLMAVIDQAGLSDQDEKQLKHFKKQLKFDSVELYLPLALFVFWIFIFWRTLL